MVDNRRYHAISPLTTQEGPDFSLRTRQVKVGKTQRDQGRIPIPLMGVLVRAGLGENSCIVKTQDSDGAVEKRYIRHMANIL